MGRRLIFAIFFAFASLSFAQVKDVKKTISTNNLLEGFDVGSGSTITFESGSTLSFSGTLSDGVKITFNPDGTNPGINVGSYAGVPSSLANGDLWYDSTANALKARINGSTVSLGAGGSGTPGGADTQVQFNDAGSFGGDSALTYNKTTDALTLSGTLLMNGQGINFQNVGLGVLTLHSSASQTNNHTFSLKANSADVTLDLAGNFTTSGANALTLTTTGATNVTLPTSGTLATVAGTEPALGNPASNGYVLSSTTGGTRSWVAASGTGTVTSVAATDGSGFDFSVADATTTPAIALACDSTHGLVKRGYANGTAVLAGTPDYDGQLLTATDGYVALGTGTSAGNVQGILSLDAGGAIVYPVGEWQFTGNVSQQSGTSQLRTLTVSTGGVAVTSGNLTLSAGRIGANSSAGAYHYLTCSGATYVDNVLELLNTTDNGAGSKGYSAVVCWHPSDGREGRGLTFGVGPDASAEYANKAYIATNPPTLSSSDTPMDVGIYQEQNAGGGGYKEHRRIYATTSAVTLYAWSDTAVEASEKFTIAASGGHATLGGGATASELRLLEPSGSGSNYGAFVAPALGGNRTYTLPDATGTLALTSNIVARKTCAVFTPSDNQPPASNYATLDTRNSIAVLDFDDTTEESAVFVGIVPDDAVLTSGIIVRIKWMATSATSGDARWGAQFERMNTDQDSDSFDTATEATTTTNGTSGIISTTEITCTSIDSLAVGDGFRLKIYRDVSGADTITGDLEIVSVELKTAN